MGLLAGVEQAAVSAGSAALSALGLGPSGGTGGSSDPILGAWFTLTLDGVSMGSWTEVDLGGAIMGVLTREQGGLPDGHTHLADRITFKPVSISRVVCLDTKTLSTYLNTTTQWRLPGTTAAVTAMDAGGNAQVTFEFTGVQCSSYTLPTFNVKNAQIIYEHLEFHHTGFKVRFGGGGGGGGSPLSALGGLANAAMGAVGSALGGL